MVAMEIGSAGLLLQLLVLVVIFAVVARRLRVPYPIVMVVAGVVISLIPGLPQIELEPDVIFSVFLPLLLYHAAWHTSWPTMQRNAWSILVLAVGLVVFTVFGIAVAAPAFLPGFDWRTGFLLGAHVPTLTESCGRFLYVSAAGVAIGLAVGYLAHRVERWIDDAPTVVASTVLVPFAAYLVAEEVRASGVLAVVACGLLHSRRADESRPPRIR